MENPENFRHPFPVNAIDRLVDAFVQLGEAAKKSTKAISEFASAINYSHKKEMYRRRYERRAK